MSNIPDNLSALARVCEDRETADMLTRAAIHVRAAESHIRELEGELDAVERTALAHEQTIAQLDALCGPGGYGGSHRVRLLIRDVRADISASRKPQAR